MEPSSERDHLVDDVVHLAAPGRRRRCASPALGLASSCSGCCRRPRGRRRRCGCRETCARSARAGPLDELGHAAHRHRDVVLDRDAVELLRLRDVLAQLPEVRALRVARGERGIEHQAFLGRGAERLLEQRVERVALGAVGELHQHVPGMRLRQRIARAGDVLEHEVEADARDQLEAGDALAAALAQVREQRARPPRGSSIATIAVACERGSREELQHRGGDDAQRALGADEEVLQVVAGVVLAQRRAGRPTRGRRAARLRGRAPARACCRSAARRCRPRWWRGCRRSRSCPRRRARAERAGRASSATLLQRLRARSRPRPSSCCCRDRPRARGSCATGSRSPGVPRRVGDRGAAQARVAALRNDRRCAARASSATTRATSSVRAGRTTAAARPWYCVAPIDLVGRALGGVDHAALAHDGLQALDEVGGNRQVVHCRMRREQVGGRAVVLEGDRVDLAAPAAAPRTRPRSSPAPSRRPSPGARGGTRRMRASGVSSSNHVTSATLSSAAITAARSASVLIGRSSPLPRRRTDASELSATTSDAPSAARLREVGHVAAMQDVEDAVGEDQRPRERWARAGRTRRDRRSWLRRKVRPSGAHSQIRATDRRLHRRRLLPACFAT